MVPLWKKCLIDSSADYPELWSKAIGDEFHPFERNLSEIIATADSFNSEGQKTFERAARSLQVPRCSRWKVFGSCKEFLQDICACDFTLSCGSLFIYCLCQKYEDDSGPWKKAFLTILLEDDIRVTSPGGAHSRRLKKDKLIKEIYDQKKADIMLHKRLCNDLEQLAPLSYLATTVCFKKLGFLEEKYSSQHTLIIFLVKEYQMKVQIYCARSKMFVRCETLWFCGKLSWCSYRLDGTPMVHCFF